MKKITKEDGYEDFVIKKRLHLRTIAYSCSKVQMGSKTTSARMVGYLLITPWFGNLSVTKLSIGEQAPLPPPHIILGHPEIFWPNVTFLKVLLV